MADYLEKQQNSSCGTAYLKMAADLLHHSLGENDTGIFYIIDDNRGGSRIRLPRELILDTKKKIRELNDAICKADPNHNTADRKPSIFLAPLSLPSTVLLLIMLVAGIAGAGYLINHNQRVIAFMYKFDNSLIHDLLRLCVPLSFIFIILILKKNADKSIKRKQLYRRLYGGK